MIFPFGSSCCEILMWVYPFTWMVKVVLTLESFRLLFWSEHLVETVLTYDGHFPLVMVHLVLAQQLHDLGAHCGLAKTEHFINSPFKLHTTAARYLLSILSYVYIRIKTWPVCCYRKIINNRVAWQKEQHCYPPKITACYVSILTTILVIISLPRGVVSVLATLFRGMYLWTLAQRVAEWCNGLIGILIELLWSSEYTDYGHDDIFLLQYHRISVYFTTGHNTLILWVWFPWTLLGCQVTD